MTISLSSRGRHLIAEREANLVANATENMHRQGQDNAIAADARMAWAAQLQMEFHILEEQLK
jgi:hypothetical protein